MMNKYIATMVAHANADSPSKAAANSAVNMESEINKLDITNGYSVLAVSECISSTGHTSVYGYCHMRTMVIEYWK